MKSLPTGTVTFLFTDIEGSTGLAQQLRDAYPEALTECRRLVRIAVQERGGQEFGTEGDATFAAFPSPRDALPALTAQQRILRHPWPGGAAVRVRMGLRTGEARVAGPNTLAWTFAFARRTEAPSTVLPRYSEGHQTRRCDEGILIRDPAGH
jgi:class 3 adenylate cyclase